jgi:hypothetical protein
VKPSSQGLHTGCTLLSTSASSSAVSVLEQCPRQHDLRLALLRPSKEDDEPEQHDYQEPGIDAKSGAQVLAVSETSTALYLPTPQPHVDVVDDNGATVASTPLPKPPSRPGAVTRLGSVLTWWTGDSVLVFDAVSFSYRYTITATEPEVLLGPAALMAGHLLVPVTHGVGVYDAFTGVNERVIPVSRPPGTSKVIPVVSGSQVFEQRGNTLVALG